ncbi:MAG: hypothetical protein ABIJ57_10925 [Pseudomonadota bacterium]
MKKLITAALFFALLPGVAIAEIGTDVQTITITTGAISASGSYTTGTINITETDGYFSIQGHIGRDGYADTGTMKCEVLLSNDGDDWFEAEGSGDVFAGYTKTSGPKSDGRFIVQFYPQRGKYMKLKFTETAGAATVAGTFTLAIQKTPSR